MDKDKIIASEALYGFAGWLTSRSEPVALSANHECGGLPPLIDEFCKQNKLENPRDGWHLNLIHPSGECSGSPYESTGDSVIDPPITVGDAMETIKQAMISDDPSEPGSYAHSWHCNIAMSFYDAWGPVETDSEEHKEQIRIVNEGASRFMKLCFDVDTKQ